MDANYAFYLHMENLKNSLYRQLSSARQSSIFWPKFYYSWFYADEKTLYNMLNLRQKLGLEITDTEVNSFNKIRDQMKPASSLYISKKNVSTKVEGVRVNYTDITWNRKSKAKYYVCSAILGGFAHKFLKMSRWWIGGAFVPVILLSHLDKKFVPYGELENFYNFVYEKRKSDSMFKHDEHGVEKELEKFDKDNYGKLKKILTKSNRTLYEVSQDLDEMYLKAAVHSHNQ